MNAFFAHFAEALDGGEADPALAAQPGFAVYRNTVLSGSIDALEANYPTVAQLVGRDWFRAAAARYAHMAPPRDARLMAYGQGFADFLDGFAPAAGLPYLAGSARLDRAWTEAHLAADAAALDARTLAALAPEALARAVAAPHPAARWHWFDAMPVYTLWQAHRDHGAPPRPDALVWRSEGALLTRPGDTVRWCPLGAAGCRFLDRCAAGATLADAAAQAQDAEHDIDIAALLALLLRQGALIEGDAS